VLALALAAAGAAQGVAGCATPFLAVEPSADKVGPEAKAAWQLAQKLGSASLVFVTGSGI
jgi:hypothetical protein